MPISTMAFSKLHFGQKKSASGIITVYVFSDIQNFFRNYCLSLTILPVSMTHRKLTKTSGSLII